jgi:membrane fusion protein, multidrug efflux system
MNNKIIFTIATVALLGACKNGQKKVDNSKLLAEAKKEQTALKEKIAKLEESLGKKDSVRAIPVEINSMTPTTFINYIDVQGKVDASNNTLASPEVPGVIQNIFVHLGQFVRKGQVIASLKTTQLNTVADGIAELDQQITFAKTLYDKQKRLWDQEIGTEVQLLGAKNNYDALIKKRTTITNQLSSSKSMFNIMSPSDGVVDAIDLKVGSAIAPGLPIGIRIVNTSNLKVKANIAENYGARVNGGDQVMLIFPDLNDSVITRIGYVTKVIDPLSRTFTAEIPISQNGKIRPNMIVKARIVGYRNDRAFILPANVIQKINGQDFVYVVDAASKSKLQMVTLGESYMGKVEILNGLALGSQVIVNGFADLNEGDKVQVQ